MSKRQRSSGGKRERYVQVHWSLLESDAYRALSCPARCLLLEILKFYNGSNNGCLGMGHREAGRLLGMHRNSVGKLFAELIRKGFIRLAKPASFTSKRLVAAWQITDRPMMLPGTAATPPSRDYLRWKAGEDFELPPEIAAYEQRRDESLSQKRAATRERRQNLKPSHTVPATTGMHTVTDVHTVPASAENIVTLCRPKTRKRRP
jgi:hypothetical protein